MVRHVCAFLFFLCLAGFAVSQDNSKPLTNRDVIQLVKSGLPETTIIGAIQAQKTNFDTSAPEVAKLKAAGVGPNIISTMMEAARGQHFAGMKEGAQSAAVGYVPASGMRLKLLTVKQHPEVLDAALPGFAKRLADTEGLNWRLLDEAVEADRLHPPRPPQRPLNQQYPAITYEWQKEIEKNPALAKGPLLDVFLNPEADWSFIKQKTGGYDGRDSLVAVFVFSKESTKGRDPTFGAQEVIPVLKKHILLAAEQAPTKMFFDVELKTCPYDFTKNGVPICGAGVMKGASHGATESHSTHSSSRSRTGAGAAAHSEGASPDMVIAPPGHLIFTDAAGGGGEGLNVPSKLKGTANYSASDSEKEAESANTPGRPFGAKAPPQQWREEFNSHGSAKLFPDLHILALDRKLNLPVIPIDKPTAERVNVNNGGLMARIYVTAKEVELGTRGHERKSSPISVLVAKLDKVEFLKERSDEVLLTVDAGKFPAATAVAAAAAPTAAAPTAAPATAAAAPATATAAGDAADAPQKAKRPKSKTLIQAECRRDARHVNHDHNSDEYKQAYDACMAQQQQ